MSAEVRWGTMLLRGASPRLLAISLGAMLPPTLAGILHFHWFFSTELGHSPLAERSLHGLDSFVFVQLVTRLGEPGTSEALSHGVIGALFLALLISPFLTGAALTEARADHPPSFRELLRGAGEHYARMFRMGFVGLIPLLGAGLVAALAEKIAGGAIERAVLESSSDRAALVRDLVFVIAFWASHVTVLVGQAQMAAEPDRRSALVAWASGFKLLARRPGAVLGVSALTSFAALVVMLLSVAIRNRIGASSGFGVFVAFLWGQIAVAAVFWGRASALYGLVALARSAKVVGIVEPTDTEKSAAIVSHDTKSSAIDTKEPVGIEPKPEEPTSGS